MFSLLMDVRDQVGTLTFQVLLVCRHTALHGPKDRSNGQKIKWSAHILGTYLQMCSTNRKGIPKPQIPSIISWQNIGHLQRVLKVYCCGKYTWPDKTTICCGHSVSACMCGRDRWHQHTPSPKDLEKAAEVGYSSTLTLWQRMRLKEKNK